MKKLAIMLSIVWIILVGYAANEWAIRRATLLTNAETDRCLREYGKLRSSLGDSWTPCWEDFPQRFLTNVASHWIIAGSFALLPVAMAWTCGLIYRRTKRKDREPRGILKLDR